MKAIGDMEFVRDFLRGAADCRNGERHKAGSDAYNRGFATQYEHQERATGLRLEQDAEVGIRH